MPKTSTHYFILDNREKPSILLINEEEMNHELMQTEDSEWIRNLQKLCFSPSDEVISGILLYAEQTRP